MNVLSVARRRNACGVADYAADIEAELRRLGHEVTVVCPWSASVERIRRFNRVIAHVEIISGTREASLAPLTVALLRAAIHRVPCSVIYHTVLNEQIVAKAPPVLRGALRLYQRALLRLLQRFATIFVLNEASVAFLADLRVRARHVSRGAFVMPAEHAASPLNVAKSGGSVVCAIVGHPYAYKRFDLAVRAFRDLDAATQSRATFVVLGGDRNVDRAAWEAVARELAALDSARLLQTGLLPIDELWRALADVDIVLMPHEDALVNSDIAFRVAAARTPAIVSPARGLRWLVETGGAIPVERWPQDATPLLRQLILDRERRLQLKAAYGRSAIPTVAEAVATMIAASPPEPVAR